jgi:hypothetical protein
MNDMCKEKLINLENSSTLDNYIIVKDEKRSEYKYATIRGSNKNIRETLKDENLTVQNIVFKIKVPSSMNFSKRIKEVLKEKYVREKVYCVKGVGKFYADEIEGEPTFLDDNEYTVSITRWFKLVNITLEEFKNTLNSIDLERFEY